jgi:hypothetical protein
LPIDSIVAALADALSLGEHRVSREIRKLPTVSEALRHLQSHILEFWRALGSDVIALRRRDSAHLYRPCRVSIQYSTLYLTNRVTGSSPKQEPLNQWVPLSKSAHI